MTTFVFFISFTFKMLLVYMACINNTRLYPITKINTKHVRRVTPPCKSPLCSCFILTKKINSNTRKRNGQNAIVKNQAFGVHIGQTPSHLFVQISRVIDRLNTQPTPFMSQQIHVSVKCQLVFVSVFFFACPCMPSDPVAGSSRLSGIFNELHK